MKQSARQSSLTTISYLLVGFLSLFIAFPIFILLHKRIPDYEWPIHSDRILLFLLVVAFVLLLLSVFRPVINFIFAVREDKHFDNILNEKLILETIHNDLENMGYSQHKRKQK